MSTIRTDYLVIGSGIAGLSFALKAAANGAKVAVLCKREAMESNTAYAQGGYALAEYAYRHDWQAKSIRPGLGAEHPDTLISRSNLAALLRNLGRLEEAEAENRAVQGIQTGVLGAEHPDTLASRSNLALVLHGLGRLEEAEAEARAVLDIWTRALGAEHPDTLTSRNNLATVLGDLGRLEEAEAEHRAVLDI